jgi:epoxyqueuosine reductase
MLIDSVKVKITARELGSDLCGIAPAESFLDAPAGFRPTDIYSECKSVIVYAKRIPPESMFAENCVPYTHMCNIITRLVDDIGFKLCEALEGMGIGAVHIPSDDPYEYWDKEKQHGHGILSMRHAAYLAGLGTLGKNTLLTNMKLGNIIQIGAVLADTSLDPDKPAGYSMCPDNCRLCIEACPTKALDGKTVDQKQCRTLSNFKNERGFVLKKCNICRKICPNYAGIKPGF